MGVLQRFERKLEGLVEGTFARVFGGAVQPVEVAAALQREAQNHRAILGRGRVLVPNDYVVELADSDSARLQAYDEPLRAELAAMVAEHAKEQGWSFVGPVSVRFERVEALATGVFHVRSAVTAADDTRGRPGDADAGRRPGDDDGPRLVWEVGGGARDVPLRAAVTVLGRGPDADLRLPDTGVSRAHAEVRLAAGVATLLDLGSTNGTTVNGRRVAEAALRDGDRIGIGAVSLVFREQA